METKQVQEEVRKLFAEMGKFIKGSFGEDTLPDLSKRYGIPEAVLNEAVNRLGIETLRGNGAAPTATLLLGIYLESQHRVECHGEHNPQEEVANVGE
jgi:hypothetical protein